MKFKITKLLLVVTSFVLLGVNSLANVVLKVGATPVPHGEILSIVKPELKKKGIILEIIEFTDYVTPNLALEDNLLDANYFQHLPYLNKFIEEKKLNLISIGNVHVEPIGVFSKKYDSLDKVPKKSLVALPNDPSNGGRALILLHNNNIITLKDPTNLYSTEFDIIKNPKKLKFKLLEAAQLPRVLKDVDFAVINGNYAMEAGLSPANDSIILEGKESPYANIVAIKKERINDKNLQILIKELHSDKVKEFINNTYNGAITTAF